MLTLDAILAVYAAGPEAVVDLVQTLQQQVQQLLPLPQQVQQLSARVKACDEMLKDPKRLEISALQSVSDMKVKAEIERIGIKEKLDQIHAFIAEGDSRVTTNKQITKMQSQLQRHRSEARQQEERAESHFRLVFLYAPLQLADNKITISPGWTD